MLSQASVRFSGGEIATWSTWSDLLWQDFVRFSGRGGGDCYLIRIKVAFLVNSGNLSAKLSVEYENYDIELTKCSIIHCLIRDQVIFFSESEKLDLAKFH